MEWVIFGVVVALGIGVWYGSKWLGKRAKYMSSRGR